MPWDPTKKEDFTRLREAMEASTEDLKPFREHYREYWRQMVGVDFSKNGARKIVPVNLMEMASTIYSQNLMGAPPRINISTFNRRLRPAGVKLEQVVNNSLKDYSVYAALQRAIRAAMGTLSVLKVGVEAKGYIDLEGYQIYQNRPYVRHVHIDDWVHDMAARAIGEWEFCGHRYEVELEAAQNDESFDPEMRRQLVASDDRTRMESGEERTSAIQGLKAGRAPGIKKTCDLHEIFLPQEQLIVTMAMNLSRPLKVVPWRGPVHGPYHMLFFTEVDGNSMPLAPSHLWNALHRVVNGLYRKLDRQSSRQKSITTVQSNDAKDGEKFTKANDGEGITVQNPNAVNEKNLGGIDQRNFAFMVQSKVLFEEMAGNLQALGGMGPGADTLGQDQMIHRSASMRVTMMQNAVLLFAKRVMTDFAYYVWQDPLESYQVEIQIPKFGPVQSQLTPQERQHDFFEHELDIEPYSMQFQTPEIRSQKLQSILEGFLLPAAPLLQQSGIQVDWTGLIKLFAKFQQLPELEDLFIQGGAPLDADTAAPQPPQQQGGGARPGGMPARTTRTYNRVSSPGKSSPQSAAQVLVQKLMGGNVQPAEMAGAA